MSSSNRVTPHAAGGARYLLIGFVLPTERFAEFQEKEPGLRAQTQNFGISVRDALEAAGAECDLVSSAPASDFPTNGTLLFRSRDHSSIAGSWFEIGFVNIEGVKHLTRLAQLVVRVLPRLRRMEYEAILVHGAHSAYVFFAGMATKLTGAPSIVILTDPPSLSTPGENVLRRAAKSIDRWTVVRSLSMVTGVIGLAEGLRDALLSSDKPWLLMEGIASTTVRPTVTRNHVTDPPMVVYVGGLNEAYGVRLLLAAQALDSDSFTLAIAGAGPMEAEVREAAAKGRNVRFLGMLDREQVGHLYARASVAVNPRPVDRDFTQYSFPSKLIEYLMSGAAVVTTRLPSIPRSCDPYLVYSEASPAPLAMAIQRALLPEEQSDEARQRRVGFAQETFGAEAQGRRLMTWIAALGPSRRPRAGRGRRRTVPAGTV